MMNYGEFDVTSDILADNFKPKDILLLSLTIKKLWSYLKMSEICACTANAS